VAKTVRRVTDPTLCHFVVHERATIAESDVILDRDVFHVVEVASRPIFSLPSTTRNGQHLGIHFADDYLEPNDKAQRTLG